MPHVVIDARLITAPGIGTYLRNLLPRVLSLRPEWRFTLLGDPAALARFAAPGEDRLAIVAVDAPIYSVSEQLALPRLTPRDADLFWAPHYNVPMFSAVPLFVTVHDIAHLVRPEYRHSLARRAYARLLFRAVARRARTIVTVSEFTRAEVLEHLAPAGDVVAVHNGVDAEWFASTSAAPAARPYVLWVGALKPHKNLPRVLEAFAAIAARYPHELIVVGRAEGLITSDAAARAGVGTADRVRYLGEVETAQLQALMAGADLLVQASLYEGFGLTALEAMAAGCPVLAARAASLPEVCGDAASYCDPGDVSSIADRMASLLDNAELRAEFARRGRLQARRFSWDRAAAETASAMSTTLGSARHQSIFAR